MKERKKERKGGDSFVNWEKVRAIYLLADFVIELGACLDDRLLIKYSREGATDRQTRG